MEANTVWEKFCETKERLHRNERSVRESARQEAVGACVPESQEWLGEQLQLACHFAERVLAVSLTHGLEVGLLVHRKPHLTHGLEVGLLVHRKGKVPEASLLKGEGEQRVREVWHRYIAARTEKGAPCGEREEQILDDFWRSICLSRIAGWVAEGMHLGIALGGQTEDLAESCMPSRGQKSGIDATNE